MSTYGPWTDQPTFTHNANFGPHPPTSGVVTTTGVTQVESGGSPAVESILDSLIADSASSVEGDTKPTVATGNGTVASKYNFGGAPTTTTYSAGRSFGLFIVAWPNATDPAQTLATPPDAIGYEIQGPSSIVSLTVPSMTLTNYNYDWTVPGPGLISGSWTCDFVTDPGATVDTSTGLVTSWRPSTAGVGATLLYRGPAASNADTETVSLDLTSQIVTGYYGVVAWMQTNGVSVTHGNLENDETGLEFGLLPSGATAVYTIQPAPIRFIYPDPVTTTNASTSPIRRLHRGDVQAIGGVPRSIQTRSRQASLRRGTTFS